MSGEPINVLVVDDEPGICDGIEAILSRAGYRVTKAFSGEDAIAIADRESFDVVLMDLIMPGLDGLETCAAIKRMQPEVRVVAISGSPSGQRIELMRSICCVEVFLEKPFGKAELLAGVARVLGGRFPS